MLNLLNILYSQITKLQEDTFFKRNIGNKTIIDIFVKIVKRRIFQNQRRIYFERYNFISLFLWAE